MENEAYLGGEGGSSILIDKLTCDERTISAMVTVKSDWYSAGIKFESSCERLEEFLSNLYTILEDRTSGHVNFINENGNFELDIELGNRGEVEAKGILIKSMLSDSRLEYYLESSYQDLSSFYEQLKNFLNLIPHSLAVG
jgi:hypothetical protein